METEAKYPGVTFNKNAQKYRGQVERKKKPHFTKYYDTAEEAHEALQALCEAKRMSVAGGGATDATDATDAGQLLLRWALNKVEGPLAGATPEPAPPTRRAEAGNRRRMRVFYGPHGSGKSTWIRTRLNGCCEVHCADSIRFAMRRGSNLSDLVLSIATADVDTAYYKAAEIVRDVWSSDMQIDMYETRPPLLDQTGESQTFRWSPPTLTRSVPMPLMEVDLVVQQRNRELAMDDEADEAGA